MHFDYAHCTQGQLKYLLTTIDMQAVTRVCAHVCESVRTLGHLGKGTSIKKMPPSYWTMEKSVRGILV